MEERNGAVEESIVLWRKCVNALGQNIVKDLCVDDFLSFHNRNVSALSYRAIECTSRLKCHSEFKAWRPASLTRAFRQTV